MLRVLIVVLCLALGGPAAARQDPAAVKQAVEDFLKVQTRGLPGSVSYTVGAFDPSNRLARCPALQVFMPGGARPWGRTTVGVRCALEGGWSAFVPVQIRVSGEYLVAARPLAQGQVLGEEDLAVRSGDLAEMPAGVLTDAQQALGRSASVGLAAGRPLRADLLRQPLAIQPGQGVKVVSRGPGFQVATDGRALNGAAPGQVVQVRTAGGQTVSGIARSPGVVDVAH